MNELLDVDPELQIHFAASQIHSALRQLGNDLAQDNLPLRKNTHALREQDGAFPQASRRCE